MNWALTNNSTLYVWIGIAPLVMEKLSPQRETINDDDECSIGDTFVHDSHIRVRNNHNNAMTTDEQLGI